jgi:hypothetical protein
MTNVGSGPGATPLPAFGPAFLWFFTDFREKQHWSWRRSFGLIRINDLELGEFRTSIVAYHIRAEANF